MAFKGQKAIQLRGALENSCIVKLLFDLTWETDSGPLWGWQHSTQIEKQNLIMYVGYYWLHSARCYKRNVSPETNQLVWKKI